MPGTWEGRRSAGVARLAWSLPGLLPTHVHVGHEASVDGEGHVISSFDECELLFVRAHDSLRSRG